MCLTFGDLIDERNARIKGAKEAEERKELQRMEKERSKVEAQAQKERENQAKLAARATKLAAKEADQRKKEQRKREREGAKAYKVAKRQRGSIASAENVAANALISFSEREMQLLNNPFFDYI